MDFKIGAFRFYRHDIGDYMRRWILVHPWGLIRLHNIRRPDADPDMHDHPFNFLSIILSGGYTEEHPDAAELGPLTTTYRAFWAFWHFKWWYNWRLASDPHRIIHVLPHTWTLVFTGPKVRIWGFWTKDGFVPWREYVNRSNKVDGPAYQRKIAEIYGDQE
jgi:hypothetical protein